MMTITHTLTRIARRRPLTLPWVLALSLAALAQTALAQTDQPEAAQTKAAQTETTESQASSSQPSAKNNAEDADSIEQRNGSSLLTLNDEAWISGIGVALFADDDADGFFSGLSISLDADTAFSRNEIYATIDIANTYSTGSNSSLIRLITTQPFYIYDQSRTDEYTVDIDLLNNYYPDYFDLYITVFDARDNRILDQVSAREFDNLGSLPLESREYDGFVPVADRPHAANDDVVAVEYVGSSGLVTVFLLLSVILARHSGWRGLTGKD